LEVNVRLSCKQVTNESTSLMAKTYPIVRLNIMNESIVFSDENVIEAEVVQEIHPISLELPASTARIRVWLDDEIEDGNGLTLRDKFRPFSDGIYHQSMTTGLVVDVSEWIVDEEHFVGRFYLENWNNTREGELELVCTDAVGILENDNYLGNFYESPTLVSVILKNILKSVDFNYTVDANVADKYLKGYIKGDITLRDALQQVLFACGAYALTSGSQTLQIKSGRMPVPNPVTPGYYYEEEGETEPVSAYDGEAWYTDILLDAYISSQEKTDSQELNILQLVTGVEITSHDYSKGTTLEEIFSAYLNPGDYMVVYPKPYWHVEASGIGDAITYLATANDEVLISPDSGTYPDVIIYTTYGEFEYGANYVYLHVPVADPIPQVVVSGKPWLDAMQKVEWVNPAGIKTYDEGADYDSADAKYDLSVYYRSWNVYAPPNVWKINDATLVPFIKSSNEVYVEDVIAKVAEYASLRYQQKATLFPRTDIELGEIDIIESLYDRSVVGVVERTTSDLTGGYLINAEFIGVEREQ
jgi:hypothetical protein